MGPVEQDFFPVSERDKDIALKGRPRFVFSVGKGSSKLITLAVFVLGREALGGLPDFRLEAGTFFSSAILFGEVMDLSSLILSSEPLESVMPNASSLTFFFGSRLRRFLGSGPFICATLTFELSSE